MECESNSYLNWNWDIDASSSPLNRIDSYMKDVDNNFFQNWLFVPLWTNESDRVNSSENEWTGSNWKIESGGESYTINLTIILHYLLPRSLFHDKKSRSLQVNQIFSDSLPFSRQKKAQVIQNCWNPTLTHKRGISWVY